MHSITLHVKPLPYDKSAWNYFCDCLSTHSTGRAVVEVDDTILHAIVYSVLVSYHLQPAYGFVAPGYHDNRCHFFYLKTIGDNIIL